MKAQVRAGHPREGRASRWPRSWMVPADTLPAAGGRAQPGGGVSRERLEVLPLRLPPGEGCISFFADAGSLGGGCWVRISLRKELAPRLDADGPAEAVAPFVRVPGAPALGFGPCGRSPAWRN